MTRRLRRPSTHAGSVAIHHRARALARSSAAKFARSRAPSQNGLVPAGSDNLEARLLVLRRRLADIDCGIALERVGRGRLELTLERPAELTEVPTRLLQPADSRRGGG
jgi:propanediol dehydratase small subunit